MPYKVIITGSTGMVGKGVLLECLDSSDIEEVLIINRNSLGMKHPKLKEVIHENFFNFSALKNILVNYDACFFCMGVSSIGLNEDEFHHLTYDTAVPFAKLVSELNPNMVFCYVSGTGTDSSEKGNTMWARVKGKTENHISALPFKKSYSFRPGYIHPMKGIKSKTAAYNAIYVITKGLFPILKWIFKDKITTTVQVGKAMINTLKVDFHKTHLENSDINELANAN